jgi:hypothetical protein
VPPRRQQQLVMRQSQQQAKKPPRSQQLHQVSLLGGLRHTGTYTHPVLLALLSCHYSQHTPGTLRYTYRPPCPQLGARLPLTWLSALRCGLGRNPLSTQPQAWPLTLSASSSTSLSNAGVRTSQWAVLGLILLKCLASCQYQTVRLWPQHSLSLLPNKCSLCRSSGWHKHTCSRLTYSSSTPRPAAPAPSPLQPSRR